ncbi:MAG: glycosyltransferase family 4 protein [Paracoccaceae bacterium]
MRVCFVSRRYFPAISGMSVYARNLLRELVAAGDDVVMVSQYRADAAGAGIYGGGAPPEVPGVEVRGLRSLGEEASNGGSGFADFERDHDEMVETVLRAHAEKPFDIVHAQYAYPTGLAAMEVSRRTGVPNVVSIQGGDGHWVGKCCETHRAMMQAVLTGAQRLLIGSTSFAREVEEGHGVPVSRFTIVPGATDVSRYHPRADRAVGDLGEVPRLLFHGRVDRRKGVFELIDAFASLRAEGRDIRLTISGIGPDLDGVRARVSHLMLDDAVEITGYADYEAAPAVYRRGDIFVTPTYSEGFSNTILEAMATGLPIASCETIGVVDCLEHERDALLVPVANDWALAAAIARLLDDARLRRRLAETALDEVRRLYSWRAVGRQIRGVYEEILGETPDDGWTRHYDPATHSADRADTGCRFRREPHLL